MQKITPGIYRHFKGKFYRVIGTAKHSETLEDMVLYEPLYESETKLWVRPLSMFIEKIEINGKKVWRFALVKNRDAQIH